MAAIAEYSTVEANASLLLTALAHGDPVPVAAIYGVLRQGQIQGKALAAVGRASLNDDDFALLTEVSKLVKRASDLRDAFAHRVWFYDVHIPDVIVLSDASIFWRGQHHIKLGGGNGPTTEEHAEKLNELIRAASQIWSLDDLETARVLCAHAAISLVAFIVMVGFAEGTEERSAERQKIRDVLQMASR